MSDQNTYDVTVQLDGRWWLVQVPALDTVGQARSLKESGVVAREVIGLWLDVDPDTIDVRVTIEIPEPARTTWESARRNAEEARRHEREASRLARQTVAALRGQGFTVRDAGAMLGLSPQRIHQLDHDRDPIAS